LTIHSSHWNFLVEVGMAPAFKFSRQRLLAPEAVLALRFGHEAQCNARLVIPKPVINSSTVLGVSLAKTDDLMSG